MSRSVSEWVGDHPDQKIPPRVKIRVFEKHHGRCGLCGRSLYPGRWDCDHIKALILGGEHRESNFQPLCLVPCHSDKTKQDVADKSTTYRKKRKSLGFKKPRTITRWRRFDGSIRIVPRGR